MADIDNLTIKISANLGDALTKLNKLAEVLGTINTELNHLDPSRMDGIANSAKSMSQALEGAQKTAKDLSNSVGEVARKMGNLANTTSKTQGMQQSMQGFANSTQNAARSTQNMTRGIIHGGESFRNFVGNIKNLASAVTKSSTDMKLLGKTAKLVFKTIGAPVTLAAKAMKSFSKANESTTKTAKALAKELTRVGKMLKLMVTRMALRKVIEEVGNGFKSLALHSEEFNASVSGMINGAKKLGYSFAAMVAPLIQALAPAILYVINLLIKLANVINQVFSALSGASSWNKAKDFTEDWAGSIEDANKQAKQLKKTVLGFDELNQLQEKYTSGGDTSKNIVDMFEDAPIDPKWKNLADTIKKYAKKLFDPIKKAWAKVGDFVKKNWKYAWDEILKLGQSVARDFWKMWEQKATQQVFENILKIIGYIGQAVGNLVKRFREAWDKNNTGYKILCNIRDVVLTITEHLKNMAKATADWADKLDFSPILEKFNEWLRSIKPVVDALMGVIEDFYTTVILPLGKWAIEEGGPKLIQVFIDFNNKVDWEGLRAKLQKLWEHLEPFAERVGEGLIIFINDCAQALANFLNSQAFSDFIDSVCKWMDNVDAQDVANGLKLVAKAILAYEIGKAVINGLLAVSNFLTLVKSLAPALKLAVIITVALEGLELGKKLGELLFPSDKELYEHYEGITGTFEMLKEFIVGIYDAIVMYIESACKIITTQVNLIKTAFKFLKGDADAFDLAIASVDAKKAIAGAYGSNIGTTQTVKDLEEFKRKLHETQEETNKLKETNQGIKDSYKELSSSISDTGSLTSKITDLGNATKLFGTDAQETANKTKGVWEEGEKSTKNYRAEVENLTDRQKSLRGVISPLIDETKQLKTNSDEVSTSFKNQKSDTERLNEVLKNGKEAYKNVKAGMEEPVKYAPVLTQTQKDITDKIKGIGEESQKFEQDEKEVWNNFSLDVANAGVGFEGTTKQISLDMDNVTKDIVDQNKTISDAFSEKNWTFDGVIEGFRKTFEGVKKAIAPIWNNIAEKLNGDHEIGGSKFKINLPKFASGGFPEDGLFMANHGEMVGRFSNGRTAVANNAQIVDGISAGVYNAVSAAMSRNIGGNERYIANTIVVDGDVIARTITRAQQKQDMRYSPSMA